MHFASYFRIRWAALHRHGRHKRFLWQWYVSVCLCNFFFTVCMECITLPVAGSCLSICPWQLSLQIIVKMIATVSISMERKLSGSHIWPTQSILQSLWQLCPETGVFNQLWPQTHLGIFCIQETHLYAITLMIFKPLLQLATKKWQYDFKSTKEMPVYHTVSIPAHTVSLLCSFIIFFIINFLPLWLLFIL